MYYLWEVHQKGDEIDEHDGSDPRCDLDTFEELGGDDGAIGIRQ